MRLTMIKADSEIATEVKEALKYDLLTKNLEISVTVDDGIVTLRGNVSRYSKKLEASKMIYRLAGVKNVVNELNVVNEHAVSDAEIISSIRTVFSIMEHFRDEDLVVSVHEGMVNVSGVLSSPRQQKMIRVLLSDIKGIRGIHDSTEIVLRVPPWTDLHELQKAFIRCMTVNAQTMNIHLENGRVLLSGYASSITQKEEAEEIICSFPGIAAVENRIAVTHMNDMAY